MKACYIAIYDSYIEYPTDGTLSLEICATEDIGFEYCIFTVKCENTYPVSLNPKDPIEDVIIPEKDQKIIQSYIDKFGGYDGLLDLTQEFYNKYMSPEERKEYHKNDIKKEIELRNNRR